MFTIITLLACISAIVCGASFSPPTKGTTVFCYTLKCVSESIDALKQYDPVYIGLLSYSFEEDSYLALYLGSLLELLNMPEYFFVAMVLQSPPGLERADAAFQFVQYLPNKSIFVSIEHGRSGTGIDTLRYLKKHGVAPKVVMHLNHEQPWQVNNADFLNHIFDSVDELSSFYSGFPLVLRNYYFTPLLNTSYYLPVGAPFDGYILGNDTSELFQQAKVTPASQRSIMCHFKGRVDYSKYHHEESDDHHKAPTMIESDEHFPQAIERREIIRLAKENKLGGCVASASAESTAGSYEPNAGERFLQSYEEYVQVLADAVFILCPAGNNPETFRHIEALEFGAIPIMLHPMDASINYLNDVHWKDYPGPILNSWTELEPFLHSMTPAKIDALQAEVKSWYVNFNQYKKQALLAKLKAVFEGTPLPTVDNGGHGVGEVPQQQQRQVVGLESEAVKVIQDLTFNDIPRGGEYTAAIQSLLVMVLRQEERIQQLEAVISQLVAVPAE